MLKYFSFYVFCLIVLAACNNATNNNTEQIKDSLVTLPLFLINLIGRRNGLLKGIARINIFIPFLPFHF